MSFTTKHRDDLEENGYTVIENAVPDHKALKESFFQWMGETFGESGVPYSVNSLVRHYSIGYLEPAWKVRLEVKKFFQILWGTDRLLTSVDSVAIGQPPELGKEDFDSEDHHWLHVDQGASRAGLHAYQGAVYLETADIDDWTFEVMEGSHKYLEQFYQQNERAALKSSFNQLWMLGKDDISWFKSQGCVMRRVAAKAGSLVLWDSRLVHANARPVKGRSHRDRWRCVTFVCMTPVAWTTKRDLEKKKEAYRNLEHTSHWPSDDVSLAGTGLVNGSYQPRSAAPPRDYTPVMPDVMKTDTVRQLMGVKPYTAVPGSRDVAWRPKWDIRLDPDRAERYQGLYQGDSVLRSWRKYMISAVCVFLLSLFAVFMV